MTKLLVSSPPHWHDKSSEAKIHFQLILALIPAIIYSIYTYQMHAVRIITLAISSAVIFEILIRTLFKKRPTPSDGSAILIGLLLALLLPPNVPYWLVIIAIFLAIFIGREIFGGLGSNPMNPVLIGWAICNLSWPSILNENLASVNYDLSFSFRYPLTLLKKGGADMISDLKIGDLLLGKQIGGIGAAAIIFLIIGGIYLLVRKVIPWEISLSFTLGLLLMASLFWLSDSTIHANPLFHLFTGNAIFGIFFLAIDFPSSPFNRWGMIAFGFGCGFLTIILRIWSIYADGVIFAILIMNLFTPMLDRIKKKPQKIKLLQMKRGTQ